MTIFASEHYRTIAGILISFSVGSLIGLSVESPDRIVGDFTGALATLVAAFLGAWFAFALQSKKEDEAKRLADFEAANRAIFLLWQFVNELTGMKQQIIDPVIDNPHIAIAMGPAVIAGYSNHRFDFDRLTFVLQTRHRQLLAELLVEEQRFHQAIEALNLRSDIHINQVQPVLEQRGFVENREYSTDEIRNMLGDRLYATMVRLTEQVVSHVVETAVSATALGRRLTIASREMFPGKQVIAFDLPLDAGKN